ncbi:TPA: hypothetical protein GFX96_23930 [Escherichia coli]|nr:hypothetical protein [Escherichia coli]HAH0771803.1 hypothetical protein [Escherichia coli]
MLSFVAILATSSPIICSGFRYFNLGYLWTTWRQLLHNCSNKYCFLCLVFGTIQPSPFNGYLFGVVRCRWS